MTNTSPERVHTTVAEIVRLLEQLPDEAARKAALADAGLFSACAGMPCPTFKHIAGRNISVCSVCPLPDRSGLPADGAAPTIPSDGFVGWKNLLMMLTSEKFPRMWQIITGASVTIRTNSCTED